MPATGSSEERPPKPPDKLCGEWVWRELDRWTCKVHDSPHYDSCEYDEDDWDWPVYGCTCDKARWVGTGKWDWVWESNIGQLLKAYYLPAITEQLNQPSLLLERLT